MILISTCYLKETLNEHIESMVGRYSTINNVSIKIKSYETLYDYLSAQESSQILLVDLSEHRDHCLNALKDFKLKRANTKLVLISNDINHYQDGFLLEARQYFVKPINEINFLDGMSQIFDEVIKSFNRYYLNPEDDNPTSLNLIYYIEAYERGVKFNMEKEIKNSKETFSYWFDVLKDNDFIVSSRGILVNLAHIKKIEKDEIILKNDVSLNMSRRLKANVVRSFDFYKEKNRR